jgi:hypothetical protein
MYFLDEEKAIKTIQEIKDFKVLYFVSEENILFTIIRICLSLDFCLKTKALVHANRTSYFKAVTKAEKRIITTELTEEILKKGRFLKAEGNQWCIVPFESARQKIAHAIQYRQRCVGQRTREETVLTHCEAIERPSKKSKKGVDDRSCVEKSATLLISDYDGTYDKSLGLASSSEGASPSELSISHLEANDFPAVSWSRTIALLHESTNIHFSDAEIPCPLQSLLRSTSDFSFGDCSLFGHSMLATGGEKEFDLF